jgi:hypothetical protein
LEATMGIVAVLSGLALSCAAAAVAIAVANMGLEFCPCFVSY